MILILGTGHYLSPGGGVGVFRGGLETVNRYERGSGAKLNTAKSKAMWFGRWRANGASRFGLKWVNKLKILGVYFSNRLVNVDEDTWRCK